MAMATSQANGFKRLTYIFRGIVKAGNASKDRGHTGLFRASQLNS